MGIPPGRAAPGRRLRPKVQRNLIARREVNGMAKVMLRYVRYALTSLTTVGFAVYKSS